MHLSFLPPPCPITLSSLFFAIFPAGTQSFTIHHYPAQTSNKHPHYCTTHPWLEPPLSHTPTAGIWSSPTGPTNSSRIVTALFIFSLSSPLRTESCDISICHSDVLIFHFGFQKHPYWINAPYSCFDPHSFLSYFYCSLIFLFTPEKHRPLIVRIGLVCISRQV